MNLIVSFVTVHPQKHNEPKQESNLAPWLDTDDLLSGRGVATAQKISRKLLLLCKIKIDFKLSWLRIDVGGLMNNAMCQYA